MWEVDPETKQKVHLLCIPIDLESKLTSFPRIAAGNPEEEWQQRMRRLRSSKSPMGTYIHTLILPAQLDPLPPKSHPKSHSQTLPANVVLSQASPKLGIFMCLSCSGIHRGLGVHISFVRSITMDAFKPAELARMSAGGNKPWRTFWEAHEHTLLEGRTWDECTIRERYEGEVGDEWKARLSAKVEGREYVPGEEKTAATASKPKPQVTRKVETVSASGSRSGTPNSFMGARSQSPALGSTLMKTGSNTSTASGPALGTMSMGAGGRKAQNEAYFARMGAENANRPDDLPPNQGGKFTGFGSDPWPPPRSEGGAGRMPGADEFQKDPLAALTKGFGWFGGMVQKNVNEGLQKVSCTWHELNDNRRIC
jgi:ADP-ribosylation factor GTPase-activating protein 1